MSHKKSIPYFNLHFLKNISAGLQVPVLTRSSKNNELMINFDPFVFEVIKEAQYVMKLGLHVPQSVVVLIHSCEQIQNVFTRVQMLLIEYKTFKDQIPEIFVNLLQPTIFRVSNKKPKIHLWDIRWAEKNAPTLAVFKDTRYGTYVTFFYMRSTRTSLAFDFYLTF